jgi:hypothetical protein
MSEFFTVERFLSLGGENLVEYIEPLLTQHETIPESSYELLRSRLADLDVGHTVYVLEICILLKPDDFIGHLITFLAHTDSSVCCAAFRLINKASLSLLTDELIARIATTPIVDLFDPIIDSEDRIRVGTNKIFINELVVKFTRSS